MSLPASLTGVLFDMDGTLLDTAPGVSAALNAVLSAQQRPLSDPETIRPWMAGGKLHVLSQTLGITPADARYASWSDAFLTHYAHHVLTGSQPFPGVAQGIADLTASGMPWGIVTNKHGRFARPLIEQLGWQPHCVITSDQVTHPKPHPLPIQTALDQLALEPDTVLYVGDSQSDVQSARAAGVAVGLVLFGYVPDHDTTRAWQADAHWDTPDSLFHDLHTRFQHTR